MEMSSGDREGVPMADEVTPRVEPLQGGIMHVPSCAYWGYHPACCSFVPPHILETLAAREAEESTEPGPNQQTAVVTRQLVAERQRQRLAVEAIPTLTAPQPGQTDRAIYDDQNQWNFDVALVRGEGDPPVAGQNVNQAYDHAGAARDLLKQVFNRDGADNAGMTINVNVNFGVAFNNAFWDGVRLTMGNGDNVIFVDFAASPDVVGHELGHGVVQFTANLDYYSQSGALNESFADILGTLTEQRLRDETFDTANWLIGDEIMAPGLYGEALRSMAHPGTAYNNSILGQDPQPDHMSNYYPGPADNQGVHINSGICNRAFYLTCEEIGTDAAGQIWYAGLQNLWPTAVFSDAATVLAAQARILARDEAVPRQAAQAVRAAWRSVGVP
jgi:Zn-dependent metalloprotease